MKKTIILSSILFCAALVGCALILVKPKILFRNSGGISVKGYAVERVISDIGVWKCSVSARDADSKKAYAKAKADLACALEFFKSAGVPDSALKTGAITVSSLNKYSEGCRTDEVIGWLANVEITLTSADIASLDAVAKRASEVAEKGVVLSSEAPQYYYSKLESLKIDLIGRAVANARARAEKLATTSGGKLGKLISASQGVFQITRPLSTETSSYGVYETESVEKDVKCTVNVEFEM